VVIELLDCCNTGDGTTTDDGDVVVGRAGRRLRDGNASKAWSSTSVESIKTPDSLVTSEPLDDSVFDGQLDWIGESA